MPRNRRNPQLQEHLTLHAWLNDQFGYQNTRELLADAQREDEGFSADGLSPVCAHLISRTEPDSAIHAILPTYDANIQKHLAAINRTRTAPISLRYFQSLAVLYTEIFLDRKFNHPRQLLAELNAFVEKRNAARAPGDAQDVPFTPEDIEKLAFWMATGAGKTLIMHLNYRQYLHYCDEPLEHIVLITPNEGLSEQHLRELAASDIPCERFNVEGNKLSRRPNAVQVIEITKLVEEKSGGGVSVPVEAFEGNNLIFVDEGHKGSGGNVWRSYRDELAQTGFTFEYSATFGQALAAAKNAELVEEYGKAIVFDYSYRYFYGDGYGKNFRILNVKHDEETQTGTLLMGNLLSFYEQRKYFRENTDAVRAYGLESPLWAFVGSRVKAVYTEDRKTRSDVLNVIRFLHRVLANENGWAIRTIAEILNGNSGLAAEEGTDVFANRFAYLNDKGETASAIYNGILTEIFHTSTSGALHLYDVRSAQGEIALKATNGTDSFGLIYIGDTPAFKKLVAADNSGIVSEAEDVMAEGFFSDINQPNSPINILIGAKKFIEGWDSWRVSAMGLLNIGRQEGSQIIQLFGRGVRLRGKDMSLKRSAALNGTHPPNLSLLETLNIFAVRANFMAQFREYLTREGVPIEEPVQLVVPIQHHKDFPKRRLFVPVVKSYDTSAKGECVRLQPDSNAYITHSTQQVDIIGSSTEAGIQTDEARAALERKIPEASLKRVDWEKIHLQLLEYKQEKRFHNLVFDTEVLKQILKPEKELYGLTVMHKSEIEPTTLADLKRLEALVLTLLRKYIAKFYGNVRKRWSEHRVRLGRLDENDANFTDWTVYVPRAKATELEPLIHKLIEAEEIYGPGLKLADLPNVYNDRHLYQPLLTVGAVKTSPPALEESEQRFVADLRHYIRLHREEHLAEKEIFLLRNQSRGKGIGFYHNEGFYPDFILWITEGMKQRIVFIEPHGMVHEAINARNDKVNLFKRLRDLSYNRFRGEHVQLDAFIISRTPFVVLRKREDMDKAAFAEQHHILFPDLDRRNPTYLAPIFTETF